MRRTAGGDENLGFANQAMPARGGANVTGVTNPVVHFEILGRDGPALIEFYRDLFGWQLQDRPLPGWPNHAMLRAEQGGIGGAIGSADAADGATVVVYVEVDDLDAYLVKAQQLGATVVIPVTRVTAAEVTVAWLRDPQGNIIGVVHSDEAD